ncbi:Putative GroES-like superfamily, alcohol dehydrogenase, alcohol dehydrogenase, zinc-binding type 1 [Septoria linicola]|uniref:GroES-like superfamily, alcohol dehydrogenase, alcohol dehydrogenase, zinc-binding type 1 n=1 Tax=Septoria linicola TaxID=215465 RepID=A0A9Q9AZF9_9PEZI|nr:putative GroES-like superfamily, alcohol dehydrogenase, alcohol dehydrogenase, zinc-binding type 1 [Septoria linicola]USW54561.1 Putative GroES-like superfamily, alcohol dehydrogenase, alcohol dehydrogenase, zinc-binding type 1 [Septoria linicola]
MSIKAIQFKEPGPPSKLELTTIDKPKPEAGDLLVKIKACAVNPIDTKVRQGAFPASNITGYDAAGIVEAVGSAVKGFKEGDEVYYSGALGRQGTTAQYSIVDHRIAAHKPKEVDFVTAATIPLVTLTAWEMLEEQFNLVQDDPSGKQKNKSLVIINGAGGVGSVATQLARRVFKLGKVIVTASRPETIKHAEKLGATHVINHHKDLKEQLKSEVGIDGVDYVFICYDTTSYLPKAVDIANAKARIGSIVEVQEPLKGLETPDAFMKALSFHWELMFSKAVHKHDEESQGEILRRAATLFDRGDLISIETERHVLSVRSLIEAHEKLESGKSIGKIGLEIGDDIE